MSILNGKNLLLGISGGIAAYKSAALIRSFIKCGANVQVIMTPSAKDFVTPLTLSTLSRNPVYSDFFDTKNKNELWNNHVDLGLWADYFVIAPATSNTISKMASARSDNLLIATYLSAKCPVFFAPAMDLDMYKNKSNQNNIDILIKQGKILIPVESGLLASGLDGPGRMKEPDEIVKQVSDHIQSSKKLYKKKILITAGPTYEKIDKVRFIGNFSSGKMGFAMAETAADLGAEVFLVTGPSTLRIKNSNIIRTDVVNAEEMFNVCLELFKNCDIAILSAAVSDFKPIKPVSDKIKKENLDSLTLELRPTIDILKNLGSEKTNQILIGFALESKNEIENAKKKIKNKNLDAIILNSLNDIGAGFNYDTNKITYISKNNLIKKFKLKDKKEVAVDIFDLIVNQINE
tara:strand:+ start:268 stop:1482 length:1215 start_codon:yes stop_codon:yes gene_type:complete